jgi:hypothetical protein
MEHGAPDWFILRRATASCAEDFVGYWEQFYRASKNWPDSDFLDHLKWKGGDLTTEDIEQLIDWKTNGRKLPTWTQKPTGLIKRIRKLNKFRLKDMDEIFKEARKLSPTGLVKCCFICHIISPFHYPIWDQNVFRAYLMINGRWNELEREPSAINEENQYQTYRGDFRSWMANVSPNIQREGEKEVKFPPFRRLDRALFAMGSNWELIVRTRYPD